ncbi:MAG TPA: hypothetical protein PK082_09035 [Phycisphaerae bacterium]|nr:hypothetical protein [Phycisphaerae bacterium]
MKNAREYERKIKKLLAGRKKVSTPAPVTGEDRIHLLIEAVLQSDSSRKQAAQAFAAMRRDFVDYNELRVAPVKDIVELLGRDFPLARRKAERIVSALNGLFDGVYQVSMEHLDSKTKRDVRRHLEEIGLDPYAAAVVTLLAFGGHAVPVDQALVDCLVMEGYAHPDSTVADIQGFLERIVSQKEAFATHEFLRGYVEKSAKALAKYRADKAAAAAAAEQARLQAEKEAAEKAAAEAAAREARAAAAAAKRAAKEAAQAARKAVAAKTRRNAAARARRKAAKSAKTPARKPAKKSSSKARKSRAKKKK